MGVQERKAREFQRRENEILDAAFSLFCENQLDTVTMEMIAERAEIGRGTTYKHFKSKDEIYAHLIIKRDHAFIERLKTIPPDSKALNQLQQLIRMFFEEGVKNPEAYKVYRRCEFGFQKQNISESVQDQLNILREAKLKLVENIFQKAFEERNSMALNVIPKGHLISAGWGMLRGTIDVVMEGHFKKEIEDPKLFFQSVEKLLIHGLFQN